MRRKHIGVLTALLTMVGLALPTAAQAAEPPTLEVGDPSIATETAREKIDVLGIWAHPDDDAGFTTPCGVWQDLYDVRCGIIMATRGEGGSNSVGPEAGPDLGLRRENEDRTSHVRSGTVDIFNLDRVDFYYNTSAPLTAQVWDAEETLRRTVRIIRETQPEILVGWTPSLDAGHGNHQYAQGRMVWEAAAAAADPSMFPEQLEGEGAVGPWQVKRILSQGWFAATGGTGGVDGPGCNAGFIPEEGSTQTVVGTWSGYDSPYTWAEGNLAGQPAGSAKTWAQVGGEGARAHPTQAREMVKTVVDPTCQRFAVDWSAVPMQPNGSAGAGSDDAPLHGAVVADPGGLPLGSTFTIDAEAHVAAGEPFSVTVGIRSGADALDGGDVSLTVPDGWSVDGPVSLDAVPSDAPAEATFTVTPAADAVPGRFRISADFAGAGVTAYNDTRVDLVPPVDGRFERTGNGAEYEEWMDRTGAYIGGPADAIAAIGAGESKTIPVVVTNRSAVPQTATVALTAPAGFSLDAASKDVPAVAPGETATVPFVLTHLDPADPGGRVEAVTATTTSALGASSEDLSLHVVPTTVIPQLAAAPALDGAPDDVYTGTPLDLGAVWEGDACEPDGTDCGAGSTAVLGWHDDALYAQVRVVDDIASAAATPDRCFGHWLVDSVELLLDPRGSSVDTSSTFKLGMFPFTDDPEGTNGNGPDGACWSRDADNHQGFSTGPLADEVEGGPNAPGVEVAVRAARTADGAYEGGAYDVEVKIPLADLPAAVGPTSAVPTGDAATNTVDPTYLGLNVTPYDSDTQDFIGQTRTAWSAFGSQQSEPYRWGHAYLDGYTPPSSRPIEAPAAIIPQTALQGVESPQTVFQSATRGGTISGLQPTTALTMGDVAFDAEGATLSYSAEAAGTARVFVWKGDARFVPVWTSSCPGDEYGFEACSEEDGAAPPWSPDMGGRLLATATAEVNIGGGSIRIPLDAETQAAMTEDAMVLVSFATAASDGARSAVNAWMYPVEVADTPTPTPTPSPTEPTPTPTDPPEPTDPPTPAPTGPPSGDAGADGGGALPVTGLDPWGPALGALLGLVALGIGTAAVLHRRKVLRGE
ncbi:PIG-L family deacetylase [Streptomyces sp. MS2A]|nr:PIG-L family deacetylase [Streptomyces sp. MS2A]